jgi:hypothetical protein
MPSSAAGTTHLQGRIPKDVFQVNSTPDQADLYNCPTEAKMA